jgi:hypothetical protein
LYSCLIWLERYDYKIMVVPSLVMHTYSPS